MNALEQLKELKQRLALSSKPFPLAALLILYETSNRRDTYCNYFEGFKLLVNWLGPIEISEAPSDTKIPKLHHTYDIQEIAVILKTSQENIYYGHSTSQSLIFISPNSPCLSSQISTLSDECESK